MAPFLPAGHPEGRTLPYYYCPVCGDVCNVYQMDGDLPRFLCRRGHRGVFEPNDIASRPHQYPMHRLVKEKASDDTQDGSS